MLSFAVSQFRGFAKAYNPTPGPCIMGSRMESWSVLWPTVGLFDSA